jgi:hypothetical protein
VFGPYLQYGIIRRRSTGKTVLHRPGKGAPAYCETLQRLLGWTDFIPSPSRALGRCTMQEKIADWRELCSQAAQEQDPNRLLELAREINTLLEEKE